MLFIPPIDDRQELVKKIHRDIGHFGIHRMLDRLKRNYWWKGMEDTVKDVLKACVPCARTKAGFRVSGTDLQPLKMQGIMFRWGIDFAMSAYIRSETCPSVRHRLDEYNEDM